AQADIQQALRDALDDFGRTITDEREKTIWDERVLSEDPKSLQDLGDEFGVSRERIRQIEAKLKKRVASFLRKRFGDQEIELAIADWNS
ncbi:MAG: hypothetical protein KC561_10090, partial [Myxococcales bacterium]|nr:hypothetical protein [Myxococcales bacterium]